jgi:hypothetical protein
MWVERLTHVLLQRGEGPPPLLEWIRSAMPAFDRDVSEACVGAWSLRNGTTLIEVTAAEGHRRHDPPRVEAYPAWAYEVADAFAVRLATFATVAGYSSVIIDKHTTANRWAVLSIGGHTPQGAAMRPPGSPEGGRSLANGGWLPNADADGLAGELLTRATGRTLDSPEGYAWWWQNNRGGLKVALDPHVIVRRRKRLLEPQSTLQDLRPSTWSRVLDWVAGA